MSDVKIPSGMASMLKMFGIDPAQITGSVATVGKAVKEIAERLERIERKLDQVLEERASGAEERHEKRTIRAGSNGR